MLNIIISNNLASFCKKANGISYVTEKSIQKHYPSYARLYGSNKEHFETYYSTITLSEEAFDGPRNFFEKKSLILALSDVAMNSERKGEKVLIEVVQKVRKYEDMMFLLLLLVMEFLERIMSHLQKTELIETCYIYRIIAHIRCSTFCFKKSRYFCFSNPSRRIT